MTKQMAIAIFATFLFAGAGVLHAQLGNAALARQQVEGGARLLNEGKVEDAIQIFNDCVARFGGDPDFETQTHVIWAFRKKAEALMTQRKYAEAIATVDEGVRRWQNDARLATTAWMNLATVKAYALARQKKVDEATAVFDACITHCLRDAKQGNRDYALGKGYEKIMLLKQLERHREVVAGCDAILPFFKSVEPASDADVEALYALMLEKGLALWELKRNDEALAAFDALLARHDKRKNKLPRVAKHIAQAMAGKGHLLLDTGRHEEASRVFETCVERFKGEKCPDTQVYVAQSLRFQAVILRWKEKLKEALALSRDGVRRCRDNREFEGQMELALALLFQAELLVEMEEYAEAVVVCDEGIRRFTDHESPRILCKTFSMMVNKGVALFFLGKWEETAAAMDFYLSHEKKETDGACVAMKSSRAHYYKGRAKEQLGRPKEAWAAYKNAVGLYELRTDNDFSDMIADIRQAINRLETEAAVREQKDAVDDGKVEW